MGLRETLETGIVCGGEVLTDTSWCIRQASAWWDAESREPHPSPNFSGAMALDRYQMGKRADVTTVLTGHWTAGEAGAKSYEDDGPRVVRGMKRRMSRKRPDRRLRVSVQFVIGACDPDAEFAPCWQTMDIGTAWSAIHVGRRTVNAKSIGVEVVSAGLDGPANVRDRIELERRYLGKLRRPLEFYDGQLRTWVRLANALSGKCLPGGIEIPRRVPAELVAPGHVRPLPRRFTRAELSAWSGAIEHYHLPGTRKIDAGTLLLQALLDHGSWSPATF